MATPASNPAAREPAPGIGADEWVASVEGRSERYAGLDGAARREFERIPTPVLFFAFGAVAALFLIQHRRRPARLVA